jgi:hypothetical protein
MSRKDELADALAALEDARGEIRRRDRQNEMWRRALLVACEGWQAWDAALTVSLGIPPLAEMEFRAMLDSLAARQLEAAQ